MVIGISRLVGLSIPPPPREVLDFVLILNHISRKQFWHIKLVALLSRTISDLLWPVKDNLGLITSRT
jgi:hypothetical protein